MFAIARTARAVSRRNAAWTFLLGMLTACGRTDQPSSSSAAPAAESSPSTTLSDRLVPDTATLALATRVPRDPATAKLPQDEHLAAQIRLGYQIVRDPQRYAAAYAGNALSCGNCHPNAGQRERGMPFVGVAATFPQYRGRDGRLISLEDRIGDCFVRSLNGKRPPYDSPELLAVAAYITWLSEGQPMGESPPWRGQNTIAKGNLIAIDSLDVTRGEQLYTRVCAVCHGPDGQGVDLGEVKAGPLWGPRSWNDGAGAARIYTLAGFIRYAMPLNAPGSLSDQDAQHVAAFINSHERPAYARKRDDFRNAEVPVDAVYYPQRYPRNPLARPAADTATVRR